MSLPLEPPKTARRTAGRMAVLGLRAVVWLLFVLAGLRGSAEMAPDAPAEPDTAVAAASEPTTDSRPSDGMASPTSSAIG